MSSHLVFMGVSGSGKSTAARAVQETLGWDFAEGDDYHPQANVEKMAAGIPLTDDDRWGWLGKLAAWTSEHELLGRSTILSCSALRRVYRDRLRLGATGTYFVHMTTERSVLMRRMQTREHFMPPSLLDSQLATLEPLEPDERGVTIDAELPKEEIVARVLEACGLTGSAG